MRKPGKISRERSAYFYSENNDEKDKYFFKVLVGNFRERLVSFQVRPLCVPGILGISGRCSFLTFAVARGNIVLAIPSSPALSILLQRFGLLLVQI
jgi:hypothetical protein